METGARGIWNYHGLYTAVHPFGGNDWCHLGHFFDHLCINY